MRSVKKVLICICLILIPTAVLLAQDKVLPGTVLFRKKYYIDQVEVSNRAWLEYMYSRKQELDEAHNVHDGVNLLSVNYELEIENLKPDETNIWYNDIKYLDKPIVLINYEQAVAYCEWRSKVVSEVLGKKVVYRLPNPQEWDDIVNHILSSRRLKRLNLNNISRINAHMTNKNEEVYWQDAVLHQDNLIYNLFDNVSEMTSEKGTAVGGNNYMLPTEDKMKRSFKYEVPHPMLGFRCIAEYVK